MRIRSVDCLLEAIAHTQLLSPTQHDALVMNLRTGFVEAADLAEDLVLRRWLTLYQAREIFRGRARQLVLGPYILLEKLGGGAMGLVFKARHRRLGRVDALKVIRPEHLANPRALSCWRAEVRAARRLSHPNVVAVHAAGKHGARRYLAMEYIEGIDLDRLVDSHGPLPLRAACAYVRQAAKGLHHAHVRGVIHRDVKPSNLLLAPAQGRVRVLDLGMALVQQAGEEGDEPGEARLGGIVMGTPDYLAPEQALNPWCVDARADIYGLGCTLYFLLAGKAPFADASLEEKLRAHQRTEPLALEERRSDLAAGLGAVVRRMMAKRPDDRFQTLAEVVLALKPFTRKPAVV